MSEFLKVAYRKLGLPMEGHDIGTMRYHGEKAREINCSRKLAADDSCPGNRQFLMLLR